MNYSKANEWRCEEEMNDQEMEEYEGNKQNEKKINEKRISENSDTEQGHNIYKKSRTIKKTYENDKIKIKTREGDNKQRWSDMNSTSSDESMFDMGKEKHEEEDQRKERKQIISNKEKENNDREGIQNEETKTNEKESKRKYSSEYENRGKQINVTKERQDQYTDNEENNPWKSDTRKNQIRFAETRTQRGYWAKIKFEAIGYHDENDKNGNKKRYNFELETVQDVLTAILRKGKLIDPSFTILPRGENDNRKIEKEESIPIMIKELNKSLWLEGERKRYIRADGGLNEIRKTIKEGFNMDMGIRFITDTLNDDNIDQFLRDWQYVARNEPNVYLFRKECEGPKKIRVHELRLRPVQEENVEEVAYILGSTSRNQDGMDELIKKMEQFVGEKLKIQVKMGYQWTTPDLGYMELTRLWTRARKEQDPRVRRATEPSIMVLYMGMKQHTKKIRMEAIQLLLKEWGKFLMVDNGRGGHTAQYQKLPGGNRGVLIPPIETLNKEDTEALLKLYERHISNKEHHNLWIQTNITDMDYEIWDEGGEMKTLREYLLNQELVPGMMAFSGVIKYQDIWDEYPQKYYLVTNNVTGEAATKKLEQLVKELIQKNPLAAEAFQDATVGPMTAFSKERNEPSRVNAYKFNLKELVETEKTRLNDIIIDGKRVMEIEKSTDKINPWNVNENSSNRTYTTAQLTQSIIGMEIMADDENDSDELTDEEEKPNSDYQPKELQPTQISQSPAMQQESQRIDNEGFTLIQGKGHRRRSQRMISDKTEVPMTKIQLNKNIATNMHGGTINVTAGDTYNLLNQKHQKEGKKEEEDSVISIGQSYSSSSSSMDSELDTAQVNHNRYEDDSSSDLEPIKPASINDLAKDKTNESEDDDVNETEKLRRQYKEIESLLKMKDDYSLQRRRNKMKENKGGRGGRGANMRIEKKGLNSQKQRDDTKSKNE